MMRIIFHCDLDCFFAAVENLYNPQFKGLPVIVGANPKRGKGRGVVSTCSYEARAFGLRSGMPISKAFELCPHGIFLRPNFEKYSYVSKRVMKILKEYSDKFEKAGLDEAYLDVTDYCSDMNESRTLAKKIKERIFKEIGLTISIGCASTKSLAKIASDHKKPNGITIVPPKYRIQFLKNMDITRIPGIGRKSRIFYAKKGISTIGDLLSLSFEEIERLFGKNGLWAWKVSKGLDERKVQEKEGFNKSLSKERTFFSDTSDLNVLYSKLKELNDKIHEKLERKDVYYRTITLKIRFEGYLTQTRSQTLNFPSRNKKESFNILLKLLKKNKNPLKKVRLIGLKFSNFSRKVTKMQQSLTPFLTQTP
ncbi:MAG: DNA polymerase IV [Candidatus Lokiarchaeota archaeon]|nr:DNA polymerase IV [Candidatus Lokiarchaeota archaeon]